jgi:hypothetical protein
MNNKRNFGGATTREKRHSVRLAKGGEDDGMFGQQQATVKTRGRVGPVDARGPGNQFATSGGAVPRNRSKVGNAAPAQAGRTGNVRGSTPRDYGKKR